MSQTECDRSENCGLNHRRPQRAVMEIDGTGYCRRHGNRILLDQRISAFAKSAAPCPEHPDKALRMTRWHGTPQLYCPAPKGEPMYTRPSGRGAFRTSSRRTYLEWCNYQLEIPEAVLAGDHPSSA